MPDDDLRTLSADLHDTPQPAVPFPGLPPGGVLIAIGADIVDIVRLRDVLARQGDRFLERVYTPSEIAYCTGMGHPHIHLAARFAAKEAVSKAFGTGIGAEVGWHTVSIAHGPRQEPIVQLDEKGRALLARCGATRVLITLSHTDTAALAVAALVREP